MHRHQARARQKDTPWTGPLPKSMHNYVENKIDKQDTAYVYAMLPYINMFKVSALCVASIFHGLNTHILFSLSYITGTKAVAKTAYIFPLSETK